MSNKENKQVLIGVVGYHNLRNYSVGPILLPELKKQPWPESVFIDEMNWGPIAIVQQFQERKEDYQRIIFLCANERRGRNIGEITVFHWEGKLPSDEQIQACIAEAVTGVISLENLLITGEYFDIWPEEVFIVDVEPGREETGPNLTVEVEVRVPEIIDIIRLLSLKTEPKISTLSYKYVNI